MFGGKETYHDYNTWGENASSLDGYYGGHSGIDIQTTTKSTDDIFYSVSKGKVIKAGGDSFNGIYVYDEVRNVTAIYLHASQVLVSNNQEVGVGQPLGKQGGTGPGVTGIHVHLEFREEKRYDPAPGKGTTINPVTTAMSYIKAETLPPEKPSLPGYRDGILLKGSQPRVYVIEDGKKRHIPDPATFTHMGFSWHAIRQISDEVLQQIPDGQPLPSVKTQKSKLPTPQVNENKQVIKTTKELQRIENEKKKKQESVTSAADKNPGDEIGNYKGVKAYSNGSSAGTPKGEKIDYQCLAYVQRFYEKHYFALGLWGNARAFWDGFYKDRVRDRDLPKLKKVINVNDGKSRPQPDDIVYFDIGLDGHVAIVTGVNGDNVKIIEQNSLRNKADRIVKLSEITGWLTTKPQAQRRTEEERLHHLAEKQKAEEERKRLEEEKNKELETRYVEIVTRTYKDILKREPDPEGLQYHVNKMKDGMNERQLRSVFLSSEEYKEKFVYPDTVKKLYMNILKQSPNQERLTYYVGLMKGGWSEQQVRDDLERINKAVTAEQEKKREDQLKKEFAEKQKAEEERKRLEEEKNKELETRYVGIVTRAYKDILKRTPDQGGLQTYVDFMKKGGVNKRLEILS